MPKLTLTVGMSGSGKTSWANEQRTNALLETPENTPMIICRDDIRYVHLGYDQVGYKPTKQKEKAVSALALEMWEVAVELSKDVIIADTNLNPVHRGAWVERANSAGYEVEIKTFPMSYEDALARNLHRGDAAVKQTVLANQWKMWSDFIGRPVYTPDPSLPKAVLIDIDGTIAIKGDRDIFDWKKVGVDLPNTFVINMIQGMVIYGGYKPIFMSGRDEICREETMDWIEKHFIGVFGDREFCSAPQYELFMRPVGDNRKDSVVKEELFWANVADKYKIVAAFDDRPQVVEMWHDIKIPNVIAVADQRDRF